MSNRMRSPSYPSTPLEQAIDYTRTLHAIERTNPVDRDVAAKALGYSGLSGRSATVLSNLIQFGLLEKAGKNEVRVTDRAVEILHPDSKQSKADAILDAANEPELFQKVSERFTDGRPSENALESFLVKLGFTNTAIPSAIRAYRETFEFLENAIENESYWGDGKSDLESQSNQNLGGDSNMIVQPQTLASANQQLPDAGKPVIENGPSLHFAQKKIWLGGVIGTKKEAQDFIETINALMPMLLDDDAQDKAASLSDD